MSNILKFLLVLLVSLGPVSEALARKSSVVNSMNLNVVVGANLAFPSISGVTTTAKPGLLLGVMPDFCGAKMCAEMDLLLIKRRFEAPGTVHLTYAHICPNLRFFSDALPICWRIPLCGHFTGPGN